MKIGIAGYGFVGKAQALVITESEQYDILISDPRLNLNDDLSRADAVIIAVATPPADDGSCDVFNVFDVVSSLPIDMPILIKSTMSVEGWDLLVKTFPKHRLCFSPEFLREASWQEDAFAEDLYLGGDTSFWETYYSNVLKNAKVCIREPRELIAGKAFRNSFLATKVAFFNQIYDYCQAYGLDYYTVRQTIADDERIGYSHTDITEQRGFGGHCFPKDSMATTVSAKRRHLNLTILEEAIEYNNSVRKEKCTT